MEKLCKKCNSIKPIIEFGKLGRSGDGYNYQCKKCSNDYYNALYPKFKENKLKVCKIRYQNKRDEILIKSRERYDAEKQSIYSSWYRKNNRDKINAKFREYHKEHQTNDPQYRLARAMRKVIHLTLKSKKEDVYNLLGYNKSTLISWLGKEPLKGESIDHRIPISWFVINAPINIISDYRNLQILPLCENCKKGKKYADSIIKEYYDIALQYIKDEHKNKITYYE